MAFSTCPLLVAACWAVLMKMETDSRVDSSSLVQSLLGRPEQTCTTRYYMHKQYIISDSTITEWFLQLLLQLPYGTASMQLLGKTKRISSANSSGPPVLYRIGLLVV